MVYQFRQGSFLGQKVNPQKAGERLEHLCSERHAKNLSALPPGAVVDDARPKSSPLHGAFEWDNTAAAEAHRLQQARELLGSLVVVKFIETEEGRQEKITVRGFVNVRTASSGNGYVPHAYAMSDTECRAYMLADAENDFQLFKKKYENLSALARLFSVADEIFEEEKAAQVA